jgi:hypothetical protein
MSEEKLSIVELIQSLEQAGRYPQPDLIQAIWNRKEETSPLLLEMFREAYHDYWPDEEDPRWYRFVHAGSFMMAWRVEEALPIFADLYMDDELQDLCEWYEESPADYGPVAIPYFARVLQKDSGKQWDYGRGLAGSILAQITLRYPETGDEIGSIFRALLPPLEEIPGLTDADYDEIWSSIVSELAMIQDEASREQVLALFDADMVDSSWSDRTTYLRDLTAESPRRKPNEPYNLLREYQGRYEDNQQRQRRIEAEERRQRQRSARRAQPRTRHKIGRNEPCPCGSGKKYKKCHGRPGMQWEG